jgi:hypothetical protein
MSLQSQDVSSLSYPLRLPLCTAVAASLLSHALDGDVDSGKSFQKWTDSGYDVILRRAFKRDGNVKLVERNVQRMVKMIRCHRASVWSFDEPCRASCVRILWCAASMGEHHSASRRFENAT